MKRYMKSSISDNYVGSAYNYNSEQKQYVYRCVAESPKPPYDDPADNPEAWSEFARDNTEYQAQVWMDAVEDGIFEYTNRAYSAFIVLWDKAETDMARPYA